MDQKSRMMRNVVISTAILALAAALGYVIHIILQNKTAKDSPAEVVGGSIFLVQNPQPASCPSVAGKICGQADDTTKLDFENLGNLTATTATYGWRIHVSSTDQQHTRYPDALIACSDPACAPSIASRTTFYVQLQPGEIVDPSAPPSIPGHANETHFHDPVHCSGPHEDRKCDRALDFTVDLGTQNGTWVNGNPVTCEDNPGADSKKRCRVFIGTVVSH